jgi:uncharacterized protein YdbL (DUF1318 family)
MSAATPCSERAPGAVRRAAKGILALVPGSAAGKNPALVLRSLRKAGVSKDAALRPILALLALLAFLGLAAPGAQAQSAHLLDGPRAKGLVGERFDGYAVPHGSVTPDIAVLIEKVNTERRAIYTQRAQAQKVPVEAVGKIYAQQIINSAPPGTWFLGENGQWAQKK